MSLRDHPVLLELKRKFEQEVLDKKNQEQKRLRAYLQDFSKKQLAEQVRQYDTYDKLKSIYAQNEVPNDKLSQADTLHLLEREITKYRDFQEAIYSYSLSEGNLPPQKLNQYNGRLRREGKNWTTGQNVISGFTAPPSG